jgi:ribonuclease D
MRWVDDDDELRSVVEALRGAATYFIDTEFESARRQTTLSVIQVSAGEEIYLLDALRLRTLEPIAAVVARAESEWVLHAGLQDVELLLDRFEAKEPPRLFDTQVAWAMQGPEAGVSLAYLKYKVLGIRSMKTHQAEDWMRRPLPRSQLAYAAADVEHLPAIHKALSQRLQELDRADLVDQVSREFLCPVAEPPADLSMSSFRNAWQLEPRNQAALSFVIEWHNGLSSHDRKRCPPTKTLLAIASRLPPTVKDLKRLKGVPAQFPDHLATSLVRGLLATTKAKEADFERIDPPAYGSFQEIALDAWLASLRAQVCAEVSMAPEVAFPSRMLKRIKPALLESANPAALLAELSGWRDRVLGSATQAFLARQPMPAP